MKIFISSGSFVSRFELWKHFWNPIRLNTKVLWIMNWWTLMHIMRRQTLSFDSPDGRTFLCEMTSWPPSLMCDVKSKIGLRQSMRIYSKIWSFLPVIIPIRLETSKFQTLDFLQRVSIACYVERCTSYSKSVRPSVCLSVRPSHAGTVSKRLKLRSRRLHCRIAPWL